MYTTQKQNKKKLLNTKINIKRVYNNYNNINKNKIKKYLYIAKNIK